MDRIDRNAGGIDYSRDSTLLASSKNVGGFGSHSTVKIVDNPHTNNKVVHASCLIDSVEHAIVVS